MQTSLTSLITRVRAKPLIAIGAVNALMLPLVILTSLGLAHALPKAAYGQLIYFYSGSALLRLLLNFGLGTVLSRDVAAAWDDRSRLNTVVYSMLVTRLSTFLLAAPPLALVAWLVPAAFWGPMVAAAIAASLADFCSATVAGSRRLIHIAALSVCQPVIYLLVVSGLLMTQAHSSVLFMLAYGGSFFGVALVGLGLIVASKRLGLPQLGHYNPAYTRTILGFAAPSYLSALLGQGWSSGVTGSFGLLGQFERSAEFGIAFSMIALTAAVSAPTALSVFLPHASQLFARAEEDQGDKLRRYLFQSVTLLLHGLIWSGLLFITCATIIVGAFGPRYTASAPYVVALAPVSLLLGLIPFLITSLFAIGRPWRVVVAQGLQLCILPLVFISAGRTPTALIAAITSSALTCAAVQLWALRKSLLLGKLGRTLVQPLSMAAGCGLLLSLLSWLGLPTILYLMVVVGCTVLYGLLIFNWRMPSASPALGKEHR